MLSTGNTSYIAMPGPRGGVVTQRTAKQRRSLYLTMLILKPAIQATSSSLKGLATISEWLSDLTSIEFVEVTINYFFKLDSRRDATCLIEPHKGDKRPSRSEPDNSRSIRSMWGRSLAADRYYRSVVKKDDGDRDTRSARKAAERDCLCAAKSHSAAISLGGSLLRRRRPASVISWRSSIATPRSLLDLTPLRFQRGRPARRAKCLRAATRNPGLANQQPSRITRLACVFDQSCLPPTRPQILTSYARGRSSGTWYE